MQAAAASAEAGLSQPEQRYSSTLLRLMQITVECALDWSKSWGLSSVCVHGCVKGWGCTRVCAMGEQTAAVLQGAPRCLLLLLAEPRQYSWHFGAPSCCCRCFGGGSALLPAQHRSVPTSDWSARAPSRSQWTLHGQQQLRTAPISLSLVRCSSIPPPIDSHWSTAAPSHSRPASHWSAAALTHANL